MITPVIDSLSTIHVSPSGNNANSGIAGQYPVSLTADAKQTINGALSAVPDGGTIIIWPGTYTENVDIYATGKSINVIGTHRKKCIITQSADRVIELYEGCTLANVTIQSTWNSIGAQPIWFDEQDYCSIINVDVDGIVAGDAMYGQSAENTLIKGCFVLSLGDAVSVGPNSRVEDTTIICSGLVDYSLVRGLWTAGGGGSKPRDLFVKNCIILMQPSWGVGTGKSAVLYESDADVLVGINAGGNLRIINTNVVIDGTKPANGHADSYFKGNAECISDTVGIVASNCKFVAKSDANQSYSAYGFSNCNGGGEGNIFLNNCAFETSGTVNELDIEGAATCIINAINTSIDASKIDSAVSLTINGISEAGFKAITGLTSGGTWTAQKLFKVWAAFLTGKKQLKSGETDVYEFIDPDDGSTVVFEMTVSNSSPYFTFNVLI